jgi:hypothetical protein
VFDIPFSGRSFWPFFLARFDFLPSCLFLVPYPVDPVHPVDPVIFFSGGNPRLTEQNEEGTG